MAVKCYAVTSPVFAGKKDVHKPMLRGDLDFFFLLGMNLCNDQCWAVWPPDRLV